jgi:hypothetical protein
MIGATGKTVGKARTQKRTRRLPAFRSDAEERKFWETREPGDYVTQTRPTRVRVSKRFSDRVKSARRQRRAG